MIIEALTFKLALDFLKYLKKNRIDTTNINISFWDKSMHEYINIDDVNSMSSYFDLQYTLIDKCILGSFCTLNSFNGNSDLYDFTTQYRATDITGLYKLTPGSQFDIERNSQRDIFINRQVSFIDKAVKEYVDFLNEIKRIYVTGIYSPCYAVPGWSENTSYLNLLRIGLLELNQDNSFQNIKSTETQSLQSTKQINFYDIQKKNLLIKLEGELLIISNRINFINDIIDGNINLNITPLSDISLYLDQNNYDKINGTYDYLLNMPLYTLNLETIQSLEQLKLNKETQLSNL